MVAVDRQKAATKEGVNLIDACLLKWNLILQASHYHHHGTYPHNEVKMLEDFHKWIMSTPKGDEAFKSTIPEWCETEAEIFIAYNNTY